MPTTEPRTLLRVAAAASVLSGLGFVALAVPSVASGHGSFSAQIAAMLAAYGLLLAVAGVLLWRGLHAARGAVIALALLNAFVAAQYLGQPLAWALLVVSVATVASGVWAAIVVNRTVR